MTLKKVNRLINENIGKFTFFIAVFLMISMYIIGINVAESKQQQETAMKIAKKESADKIVYNETVDMLTKWVYSQNNKIPRDLAREIVMFTYQNCHYSKIVLGIIGKESNFDIFAFRDDTSVYGLGQIQYESWKKELVELQIKEARDLFDWKKNILATDYIIGKYYIQQEKNLDKALSKYVGELHNDMTKYRQGVLANIGELSIIEHRMVKQFMSNNDVIAVAMFQNAIEPQK